MEFAEHLHRLRTGDTSAIREFVSVYEPFIRRSLRFRIQNSALQSAADSIDLCQSVLGTFLLRLSAGEFVLHTEEDLRNLLFSIANKKFLMLKRRESAEKRNRSLTCSLSDVPEVVNGKEVPPSFQLERGELMQQVVSRLDSEVVYPAMPTMVLETNRSELGGRFECLATTTFQGDQTRFSGVGTRRR